VVAVAPGRINIIGEHTDYAGGLCLPAAVDRFLAVAAGPADRVEVASQGAGDTVRAEPGNLRPTGGWADTTLGVLAELAREGVAVAVRLAIASEIPAGAGLSSSAAVGVAVAMATLKLRGAEIDGYDLARLCRRAENHFLGVPSGLMDQSAIVHGRRGKALFFNAATEIVELVPLPPGIAFLVVESGVQRTLRGGRYGDRQGEAAEALRLAQRRHPGLRTIAELEAGEVEDLELPEPLNRRARHIAGESQRVRLAIACIEAGNVGALGQLMLTSQLSLARDCEVSTPELDALVREALDAGAAGARLMGAGFGGSVIAIADSARADEVAEGVGRSHPIPRVEVVDGAIP
jgi:galactokinase